MSSNMKNRNPIVARPSSRAPVTLRDVHDSASEVRQLSALRRLAHFSGAPLESMPADIDWFNAHFPRDGAGGANSHWVSARAYRRWRSTVRGAIRRQVFAVDSSNIRISPAKVRHLSIKTARYNAPIPASHILQRAEIDRALEFYSDFLKAASGPKSD